MSLFGLCNTFHWKENNICTCCCCRRTPRLLSVSVKPVIYITGSYSSSVILILILNIFMEQSAENTSIISLRTSGQNSCGWAFYASAHPCHEMSCYAAWGKSAIMQLQPPGHTVALCQFRGFICWSVTPHSVRQRLFQLKDKCSWRMQPSFSKFPAYPNIHHSPWKRTEVNDTAIHPYIRPSRSIARSSGFPTAIEGHILCRVCRPDPPKDAVP